LLSFWHFVLTIAQAQELELRRRLNPGLDDIVPAMRKWRNWLTASFSRRACLARKGGYLLFSDIPANVILQIQS